jgi:TRAP-type C4-dicarboxylate transport system permease small subunit
MRRALDTIYWLSGVLAVLLLIAIGVLTVAQVTARMAGTIVPSADDFATFAMAGAIFLGLTHTYRVGGHVRVRALQLRIGAGARRWMEAGCLAVAAGLVGFLAWYTLDMILTSYRFNEYSLGLIPIPKWIPMTSMLAGFGVLLLALLDDLTVVLSGRRAAYSLAEDAASAAAVAAEPSAGN